MFLVDFLRFNCFVVTGGSGGVVSDRGQALYRTHSTRRSQPIDSLHVNRVWARAGDCKTKGGTRFPETCILNPTERIVVHVLINNLVYSLRSDTDVRRA